MFSLAKLSSFAVVAVTLCYRSCVNSRYYWSSVKKLSSSYYSVYKYYFLHAHGPKETKQRTMFGLQALSLTRDFDVLSGFCAKFLYKSNLEPDLTIWS